MWKMVVPSTGLSDYVPNGERCKHYNLTHENWIMYRCGDKIRNGAWYIIEAYKKGLICKPLDYDLLTKEAEYGEWGESPELKKYRDEKREIMMVKDRGLFSMLKYRIKKRFMNKEN